MSLHSPRIASICIALLALAVQAQTTTTMTRDVAPGKAVATETTQATASVASVDAATRLISLKQPDGRTVEMVAGPEVKNFDQIKVGDKVRVEYVRALSLELKKGAAGIREGSGKVAVVRSPAGAKPGGAAGARVTIVTDVVAVDSKAKVVTLRGPKGNMVDLRVDDPAQLANIKVGDQVEAVYAEALAVKVDPAPK